MKRTILFLLALTSFQTFAATWKVEPIEIDVQVQGNLVLTDAKGLLECDFDNIGEYYHQHDYKFLSTKMVKKNSNTYTLSIDGGELDTRPVLPLWPRDNCTYIISFDGNNTITGDEVKAYISLAVAKRPWRNESLVKEMVENLKEKPLILTILKYDNDDSWVPQIFRVNNGYKLFY